jgi:uncharacterized protein
LKAGAALVITDRDRVEWEVEPVDVRPKRQFHGTVEVSGDQVVREVRSIISHHADALGMQQRLAPRHADAATLPRVDWPNPTRRGAPMPALFPDREALAQLCGRHRIRRLSLFGSVAVGTARPDSDVDLLVEFAPAARPSLLDMAAIEAELSALLGGRRVDLRTARELSRYFREQVLQEAELQFAAA